MKKLTVTEQFRSLEEEIDSFIEARKATATAKTIYEALNYTGSLSKGIRIWTVEKVEFDIPWFSKNYRNRFVRPYVENRASLEKLDELKNYFEAIKESGEPIYHVFCKEKDCKMSTGIWVSQIDDIHYSLDVETLNASIENHNKRYEELYAPREGYVACDYCNKQIPVDKAIKHTIYYIGTNRFGRPASMTRVGTFCSAECANNEQCACEG